MIALELVAIVSFLIFMLMYSLEIKFFFMQIKKEHNEEYIALNSPKWNFQLGDATLRLAMKYIKTKGYLHLEDTLLVKSHAKMKLFQLLALLCAIVTLITAFYTG